MKTEMDDAVVDGSRGQDWSAAHERAGGRRRARSQGQVLVIFVASLFALLGMMAIVVDVSWYWVNSLRVQRAADAAALAGAVLLPGDVAGAKTRATNEASKNGYTAGGGVTVTPVQDPINTRQMDVSISAPVPTFFMRIAGINTITASRTATALYVLPLPMGSPENYYGVFGTVRHPSGSPTTAVGPSPPTSAPGSATWTSATSADGVNNNAYAVSPTSALTQQWSTFNFAAIPAGSTIDGIQVQATALVTGSGSNCTLDAGLSWNAGANWSSTVKSSILTATETLTKIGVTTTSGAISTSEWGARTWAAAEFTNPGFRIRLNRDSSCGVSQTISVDTLQVRVLYHAADANLAGPSAEVLNPRGFWGAMNSEGSDNVNGDAFMSYYDTGTSAVAPACSTVGTSLRACYDPTNYYNYAIYMPAGSTNGEVYVHDPLFCEVDRSYGTGDELQGSMSPVSAFYDLYNTNNTLYDNTDDGAALASSGSLFADIQASDATMGGSGPSGSTKDCSFAGGPYGDGRDWHNQWWPLNPSALLAGGSNGTIYRLHTTTTDLGNLAEQRNADAENNFAIFVSSTGGTANVYGLGAMEMFTPLSASGGTASSEFYLAQIDAAYAGKTIEIQLWDPGDTSPLSATLQVEIPTSSGWSATTLNYSAIKGTTNSGASNCSAATGTGVWSITTATPTSQFNGCWVTIDITIPVTYTAPQSGWWKIKYNMTGSGTADDTTTWKAAIVGNPVHLTVP